LALSTTELTDNVGHPLQPQTPLDTSLLASYDVPPYVNSVDQSVAVPSSTRGQLGIAIRQAPYRTVFQRRQLLAVSASAASFCSTSSPSMVIWISSLTTSLPSSTMLKLRPKSFRLILVVAP
jgi:hypothetical protein